MSSAATIPTGRSACSDRLESDPYVRLVAEHLADPALFDGGPEVARRRQEELVGPFLDFFLRHDRDDGHYRRLFQRKGLLNESGGIRGDVALEELVGLRIHSDDLRGDGQRRRLIGPVAADEAACTVFRSSGTSGNPEGPVTVLRSPTTLRLVAQTFGRQMEWGTGASLAGAAALMQASPEMRTTTAIVGELCAGFEARGATVHYGARLREDLPDSPMWRRLAPDEEALHAFFSSPARKVAMIPPPALAQLIADEELVRRISADGSPILDLGEGGVLITGGGLKRMSEYATLKDLLVAARRVFTARVGGGVVPAPVMDMFGLTESAGLYTGPAGDPEVDKTWVKCPHPLTWVGLLDSPQRLELAPIDEFGVPRLLFSVNLMCVDYLEAIVSGDVLTRVRAPGWPQHGLVYQRRAAEDEGFTIREGCG